MVGNIFHKVDSKNSDDPNELLNSREQISEMRQRLMEYMKQSTQHFSMMEDRLNKLQAQMNERSLATSGIDSNLDVDSKKIETKIAEMSEEIDEINKTVNVTIKGYLKEIYVFMREGKEKQEPTNKPSNQEGKEKQEPTNKPSNQEGKEKQEPTNKPKTILDDVHATYGLFEDYFFNDGG